MGNPYLSSDESLILSTHTIQIGGVSLDLMLTSRRLIFINNAVTPFQLWTIPLETIITVVAGKDVKGDPIITMTHMDPSGTGAPHPIDLIFSRQKGEERVTECSEWAATLRYHASGARNEALSTGTLPYDPVKVLQPLMSATYRIETCSPRKTVVETSPSRTDPVTSPLLRKAPADDEIPAGTGKSALTERGEMVEIVDSSVTPSGEPEIPDAGGPVSLPAGISIGADEDLAITDAAQIRADTDCTVILPVIPPLPVSEAVPDAEPEAAAEPIGMTPEEPGAEMNKDVCSVDAMIPQSPVGDEPGEQTPQEEEPVSPRFEIPIGAYEDQAITDAIRLWADEVQPETIPAPVIPPRPASEAVPDAEPEAAAEPIGMNPEEPEAEINKDVCSVDAMIPQFPVGDEPGEQTPQEEEPVSRRFEIPIGANEDQAITDAIRLWADEVRTETIPAPVIPPLPVSEAVPDAEPEAAAEPIGMNPEEPEAEINKDLCSVDAMIPQFPVGDEPGEQTGQKTAPVPASVSLPAIKTQKRFSPTVLIAATVVVILAVLGGAVIGSFYLPGFPETTPQPAGIPVVTIQPVSTLLPTPVPSAGVWVRIEYPQTFIGEVGNPELMRPVSGSGVQFYKILWNDRIVKASAQKQDNSGDTLLLDVYNNGILIKRSSTRVPMGSVEILVDPITGNPPGIGF